MKKTSSNNGKKKTTSKSAPFNFDVPALVRQRAAPSVQQYVSTNLPDIRLQPLLTEKL